jgi:hypothetical protein
VIRVHIERLVLDGIDVGPGDADRWRTAVERHLADALLPIAPSLLVAPAGPHARSRAEKAVVVDSGDPAGSGRRVAQAVAARLAPRTGGGR